MPRLTEISSRSWASQSGQQRRVPAAPQRFLKGGAAVTDNKYSSFFTATGVQFNQASDTRWGGAAGAGIEIGFAPNWSVAVEYDHLFMGNPSVTFPASAIAVTRSDNIRQDVDMGTVRVNYRFGGPVVAKY
jgi:outer membrane immunogenic protein